MNKTFAMLCLLPLLLLGCASDPEIYTEQEQVNDLNDQDDDGVINARDLCPDTPVGSTIDNDGCPERQLHHDAVVEEIAFGFDRYDLTTAEQLKVSGITKLMKDNPETQLFLVGDTSIEGTDKYNENLAERRVETVLNQLVSEGIKQERFILEIYSHLHHLPITLTIREHRLVAILVWPNEQEFVQDWTIYDQEKTGEIK
ncbi:OmpA family protein [Thalassotalea agarivorans]|uniref:OmpA family protein n=1 Tax=Thalassotalea agarivorans TaxID=349064 RepID=A0A1I0HBL2_THASX|nr:OmpA family protein [Thalassotalea agarivorans]SET81070.1 OmpA family protein [Thalassotalea agarivorans]